MSKVDQPLVQTPARLADYLRLTSAGRRAMSDVKADDSDAFFNTLIEQGAFRDVSRAIPFFMSNRQACWWVSLCIWHSIAEKMSTDEHRALDACVKWVIDPSPRHRLAANTCAESAGIETAAGCLGKAVMVSQGGPEDPRQFPAPKPELAARLCSMATLACYFAGGRKLEHRQAFSVIGLEVFRGRYHWELPSEAVNRSRLPNFAAKGV